MTNTLPSKRVCLQHPLQSDDNFHDEKTYCAGWNAAIDAVAANAAAGAALPPAPEVSGMQISDEAFKSWYYKHGADWSARSIRPVWQAAWDSALTTAPRDAAAPEVSEAEVEAACVADWGIDAWIGISKRAQVFEKVLKRKILTAAAAVRAKDKP